MESIDGSDLVYGFLVLHMMQVNVDEKAVLDWVIYSSGSIILAWA